MENQNDIRGLLKDQFQHFEAEPPVDLWPVIETELAGNSRKRPLWLPYLAIAASAVILLGLWQLLSLDGPVSTTDSIVQEEIIAPVPAELEPENLANLVEEQAPAPEPETISPVESAPRPDVSPQRKPRYAYASSPEVLVKAEDSEEKEPEIIENQAPSQLVVNPLNQISPINPELAIQQASADPIVAVVQPAPKQEAIPQTNQMRKVKNNKLDLDDFSLQNVVNFASNEISKWANSPLDYEHEVGQNAERKSYAFELGSIKITRTSYKKTINQ